ncbi:hypothetical protein N9A94_07500 [Akkermansiaceae bacterium]|nr:hypothetical protein [Akkermansiaceae bacterium]MDA7887855.1 hypothetical protein [Akkermansiaceae bacterium]MDB4544495.1 hypothetical protein [Akkermansiaceae bacterium]
MGIDMTTSTPPEDLALGYDLIKLCKESGARSGWIQLGASLIDSNLAFAETRVSQMAEVIDEMVSSYASVGRPMETMFFGFSKQYLLVVCEGEKRLALLFPEGFKPLNKIILLVRTFLRERRGLISQSNSAGALGGSLSHEMPQTEVAIASLWSEISPKIKGMLCQVVNSGQAQRLIDRALVARSLPDGPPDAMIVDVSRQIISQIPHRGKQAAILAELNDLLDSAGLL